MSEPAASGLERAYSQLLAVVVDSATLDEFLDQLVRLTAQVVTPVAACSVTVQRDRQPLTAASSNALALRVDQIQYREDDGPCLDALRTGRIILVDDMATERRWRGYRPDALTNGIASSLSVPLTVDGQVVAALNLYAEHANAFHTAAQAQAEAFAAQCGHALAVILRQNDQAQVRVQLAEAMVSRSIIDQAIGILMAEQRCSASTAFDLLRQASQNRNRKLRDIAAEIITNVTGQPPDPPTRFAEPPVK